jgi:hypothetical protein
MEFVSKEEIDKTTEDEEWISIYDLAAIWRMLVEMM